MTTVDASLFDLLRETLPVSAGVWAASYNANKQEFADLVVQDVHPYIAWIAPSKSFVIPTPPLLAKPRFDFHIQRLWTFEHDAADPATVSNVWCRVNNAGFVSHKVLDRIEWGYEDMVSGIFEKAVLITTTEGKEIKLPLTPEFVHTKLLVTDGYLPEGENPLWPLEMRLDRGMVIALVYEIGLDNVVAPWKDPDEASRSAYEGALKDVAAHSKVHPCVEAPKAPPAPPRPPHAPPDATDPSYTFVSNALQEGFGYPEDWPEPAEDNQCSASSWGAEISKGKLMPKSAAHGAVSGQVPATASAAVSPMKVLVVLSLAACRERADYEPGAVVGMARLYPHIMVRADVDLLKIEATVRYDRPDKTERADPPDGIGGEPMTCCKGYDAVGEEISSTLVADANDSPQLPLGPTLPFWSNMFNYYQTDAYQSLGQEKIKVVCNDRRGDRFDDSGLVERDIVLSKHVFEGALKIVSKMSHQGEFDNIHMAPKLKMVRLTHLCYDPERSRSTIESSRVVPLNAIPVDDAKRKELGLDDISMAPFCAHDCFHMHWRWGAGASAKWACGWDDSSAHQVAGAPLVPLNQDVYIWFRGPAKLSVHHVVGRSDGSVDALVAGECQIIMYQGAAYAVQVEDMLKWSLVQFAYDNLAAPPIFYDASSAGGRQLTISDSTAMFYWYSRWHAVRDEESSAWTVVERIRTDRARLARARAL